MLDQGLITLAGFAVRFLSRHASIFAQPALGGHAHDFRLTLYRPLKALNRSGYFLGAHHSGVFRAISGQHVFCDFSREVC
jgi:hypothetical protein